MQITHSSIIASSFSGVGNTSRRSTLADQFPAKPVTIEGQIIDDNDEKKHARKLERENLSPEQTKQETTEEQTPEENQQLVRSSAESKAEEAGASLRLQTKLNSDSKPGRLSPEQIENSSEHSFPYTNRRSSNGLAGASLIIQKYLNNEPDTTNRPDNISFSRFI